MAKLTSGTIGTLNPVLGTDISYFVSDPGGTPFSKKAVVDTLFTNRTITTPTFSGAVTWPDNIRQVFNPGATVAGLNTGAQAGDPSTPINGDLWYDSSGNFLRARINGASVSLGAGAGGSGSITASGYTQTTARILGRTTASTGAIEEITIGSGLSLSAGSLTATAGGGGTVTNTGGNLTSNALVLGAGSADTKVAAGIITDGVSKLTLGVNTTSLGSIKLFGNTSGDVTISPNAIAGTATALTLPATSGTLYVSGGTDVSVADGGTGVSTLATNGVLFGNGTGVVQVTAQGTANSVLIANAGAPSFSQSPILNSSIQLGVSSSVTGSLILADGTSAGKTLLQANARSSNITIALPSDDPSAAEFLKVTSFGGGLCVTEWAAAGGSASAPVYMDDPGSLTVPDTGYLGQRVQLSLTGTEQASVLGTGQLNILDNTIPFQGKYAPGSFKLAGTDFLLQYGELSLRGNQEAELRGTSEVIVTTFPGSSGGVSSFSGLTGFATAVQGGTGQTTYTKGDLLATPGGSTLNKLGIGTDGFVLTADAASTNGLKWAAAGAGTMSIGGGITSATAGYHLFSGVGATLQQTKSPLNVFGFNASGSALTTTGSITSGLTTLTIAATLDFVNGQGILVDGAGAAGADLVTTIVSGAGTTTLIVADAAGTTRSGVLTQHDDTVAIQAAIDAVNTTAVGGGTIEFPDGTYRCNKALSVAAGHGNSIIAIIGPAAGGAALGNVIKLRGVTSNFVADFTTSGHSGAIILADRRAGSGTEPSIIYGDAGSSVYFENLTVRTPDNPSLDGFNVYDAYNASMINVVVDTNTGSDVTTQPTNSTTAFRMPKTQNFGLSHMENVLAMGHATGIAFSENSTFVHAVVYSCALALNAMEGVVTVSGQVLIYRCAQLINCTASTGAYVDLNFSIQNIAAGGNWYSRGGAAGTLKDIDDASNRLHGTIRYSWAGGFTVNYNSATNLNVFNTDANRFENRVLQASTLTLFPAADGNSTLKVGTSGGNGLFQLGSLTGNSAYASLWMGNITPSGTNNALQSDGTSLTINAPSGQIDFRIAQDFTTSQMKFDGTHFGIACAYNTTLTDTLHVFGTGKFTGAASVGGDLTLLGHALWTGIDNTKDVGASGTNRPRTGYFGTSLSSPLATHATDDAGTTTIVSTCDLQHSSTGTPGIGFGVGLRFGLESTTSLNQDAGRIAALWTDPIHGTRSSDLVFYAVSGAAALAEVGRMTSTGTLDVPGLLIAGSSNTTLTDAAGKILTTALNTVGFAQGGTGLATLGSAGSTLRVNAAATALEYGSAAPLLVDDPGSFTIPATGYFEQRINLALTATEQVQVQSTGILAILEDSIPNQGTYAPGSFKMQQNDFLLQYSRLDLYGNHEADIRGSAEIIITTFQPVGNLVLSGFGG